MIIFIVRRKWEMIGWMIIYMLATPIFSFALPLYSFWFMDDFSWGNTRVVTGEKGQKIVVSDEGKFDPASIPKKRWEEYQAEMWEQHTTRDDQSVMSGYTYATRKPFGSVAGSEYGGMPPSRPMSHLDIPRYNNHSRLSLAQSGYGMDSMEMANLPSDDAIYVEIKDILSKSDLMQVTKKHVKLELEARYACWCNGFDMNSSANIEIRFGCDLSLKKSFIGATVESLLLSGQLQ